MADTDLTDPVNLPSSLTGAANNADSVAVIEAGALAITKVWATGLGAAVGVAWVAVLSFWKHNQEVHGSILWAAAVVTAAALIGICYIIASDIRGRAAASVATIEARAAIADSIDKLIGAINPPASLRPLPPPEAQRQHPPQVGPL